MSLKKLKGLSEIYNPKLPNGEYLGGGFAIAPDDCPKAMEGEGFYCTDTVFCKFYCSEPECPTFQELKKIARR